MLKRQIFLGMALLASEVPVQAETISDFDAMVDVLRETVAKHSPAPVFKTEPMQIYKKPYLADDTKWEKQARQKWYDGQLPEGFPTEGNVAALYIDRCGPSAPNDELLTDEIDSDLLQAIDSAFIRNALAMKGVTDIDFAPLKVRDRFNRSRELPDPGLRAINTILQNRFETGELAERIAIFEPFCPRSQRGTYPQMFENWESAGRIGSPPPPPPPPPPSPPPPPPPLQPVAPPVIFNRPANAQVWVTSELQSRICKIKTGSFYRASCKWTQLSGTALNLNGRYYRYRVELSTGARRNGTIDLQKQPSPIDLTI